jgi:leucyl/phenylalanyl-tRNA--protein transferase
MIYLLDSTIGFPDPKDGEPDGLFAVGGDLSTQRLLLAYNWGIFPWYAFRAEDNCEDLINPDTGKPYIQWWCPMKRFVIFPNEIHISHSMRQQLNKVQQGELRVTFDTDFRQVIDQCGKLREDGIGAWLGQEMKEAYTRLHDEGYATSVEVWKDDTLVGGLYGVTLGKGFFGESMFSLIPNASKIALITLARVLQQFDVALIDCQFETPHLKSMGGRYIDYDEYLKLIR